MSEELKKAFLWASVAGATFTAMSLAMELSNEEETSKLADHIDEYKDRSELQKEIISELTQELRTKFKSHNIPKDCNGWFTERFMIDMHTVIFKFKTFGKDMIAEANWRKRVKLFTEAEECKEESKENYDRIMKEYQEMLKGEEKDNNEFTLEIQECVFDYFNLIVKEYYLNIDRMQGNSSYSDEVREQQDAIQKQLETELLSKPLPEGLDKKMAEQLMKEKEELLTKIYTQLSQQHTGAGNFDLEQTVLLNKTMFEDKMYIKTGFSGKDLQRAIHVHGIYAERMKEAEAIQQRQNEKYMKELEAKFMPKSVKKSLDEKKPEEKKSIKL